MDSVGHQVAQESKGSGEYLLSMRECLIVFCGSNLGLKAFHLARPFDTINQGID